MLLWNNANFIRSTVTVVKKIMILVELNFLLPQVNSEL